MKKFFTLFLTLMTSVMLWAYDFQSGDLYYITSNVAPYTVEVTHQKLCDSSNYSDLTTVTIPESIIYNGTAYAVTGIRSNAFGYCSSLTSVTIPNSVTSIRSNAFYSCSSLKSMIVESGNTVYDSRENCNAIIKTATNTLIVGCQNTIIPNSVTSIGDVAFYGCSSLTSITIPNSVTSIGQYAFSKCSSLTSVTIPNSVTSIGWEAFEDCSSLTSVTIPNSVTSIGSSAFYNCTSLTSITIPSSVTSIGSDAFVKCPSLTSITVENGNTVYDSRESCNAIIKTAYDELFAGCQNTIIPNSVTSIGRHAFTGCSSLTSITIPESVTSIGDEVFRGCSSLNTIYVEATTPPELGNSTFAGTPSPVCHIPCGTKAAYEASDWASQVSEFVEECEEYTLTYTSTDGNIVIPNKADAFGANIVSNTYQDGQGVITFDGPITSIGSDAFRYCSSLTSVTIPNSVTSVRRYAFGYCSSLTSVTIPNSVTSIGESAFLGCSSLTSITIPNSVTSIGESAFFGCSSLTSVTIPNSVTNIGDGAFADCSSLTSVTIPNSVKRIEINAFANCSSLSSVTIPNSVTSIGIYAFSNCSSLTSITIPNSVISIGDYAFSDCSSLTGITIPKGVTSIGKYSFLLCSSLTSIVVENGNTNYDSRGDCNAIIETTSNTLIQGCKNTIIPNTVTSIGEWAFHGCSSLTSITIPEGVTSIGENAFRGCSSLTSITIPEGVTSIGDQTFFSCSSLANITLHDGITSIGDRAFGYCSSLTSITIPKSVNYIGQYTFQSCSALTSITCKATTPPDLGWRALIASELKTAYIPCGTKAAYEASDWASYSSISFVEEGCIDPTWQILYTSTDGNIVIPNRIDAFDANIVSNTYENGVGTITFDGPITSIGSNAFYGCSSLTSVTIPNSVTNIGDNAFQYCSSLTSITIPNNVTSIGHGAFGYCSSLTSVTIPNSVTSIGNDAFYDCSSLTSVSIPNSVTSIGQYAFSKCSSLNSVTIPNSVTRIAGWAFEDCSSLTTVTIPNGVTSIGGWAFNNCSSLTSVTIPNSVTSIGDFTFRGCSSLTSITIPSSVMSIEDQTFLRCSSLTAIIVEGDNTVYDSRENCNAIIETATNTLIAGCQSTTIPNSVTSIGSFAFYDCSSLTSVTIPESVTNIGKRAFVHCTSLTSVTIPNSVTRIEDRTFYNCSSLTSVTIPNSVTSIGSKAFYNCSSLNTIYVGATNPPALMDSTFTGTPSPVCHIPCGTKAAYEASAWASQVSEFVEECEEGRQIIYTSTDGNIVNPNKTDVFGANIVSNTYENGQGVITFDGPITKIGDEAFYNRGKLASITIPKSVETIGHDAFWGCKALTNVTISNGVMKIGGGAFTGSSLTSVFIPSSVTSIGIGGNPFGACPGIISIVVDENNPKYDSRNNCNGIIETATNRLISGCQNTIIPYGVTNIDNAFWSCSSLKEITIPNTVTNIGTYTFESCSLTSIVIPKSVTSIGDRAFSLCPLSSIVVEEGNPKYDSRNHCNAIIITSTNTLLAGSNNTIIPEGITAISPNAFRGRKHIASIAIPNSVTRIGEYAFEDCTSLTSITIPDGVTAIKTFAFSCCNALTSVIIGKGVNSFEQGAFFNSPVETVYFNAQEPAVGLELVTGYRYFTTSPTCYIPCGTRAAYEASVWNDYIESFIETYECTLTLSSSDNSMGSATITQEPACGTPAIIVATPNDGYFFSQWSDGNTDNPRTLTVNEDIELAAEFEEIGDYGFYSRNVRIGYNTICLPHGSIHFTGATFYEIAHILKNKKKIFFDEAKTLEAGKPYIFYPHSNEVTIYYDNTTSAVPLSHNGLHGTFDGITAASNFLKGKYLVAGNRMVLCGDGCSLAANRAYIELDEISDKQKPAIPGIKRVSMDYSEENATTALDNITDETIVAPIQEGVYDILGRKVDAPTISGFYIINGKKVFVAL